MRSILRDENAEGLIRCLPASAQATVNRGHGLLGNLQQGTRASRRRQPDIRVRVSYASLPL